MTIEYEEVRFYCDNCDRVVVKQGTELPEGWQAYQDEHYCSQECWNGGVFPYAYDDSIEGEDGSGEAVTK